MFEQFYLLCVFLRSLLCTLFSTLSYVRAFWTFVCEINDSNYDDKHNDDKDDNGDGTHKLLP